MRCVSLTWCLVASLCSNAAGVFLDQRVARSVATPVSQEAQAHVAMTIEKLEQEADLAVKQQDTAISTEAEGKQEAAKDVIEKEIPLASANDTQELAKDVAEQDANLKEALERSTKEAQEALEVLKEKTETAVNMSTIRTVRNVEKEAEEGALYISNHSLQMEAEADALSKEAEGAAKFSEKAAANSALWVKDLPVEDAANAIKAAQGSAEQSVKLRHEFEDVKRMAKLAGNMALNTIRASQAAIAQSQKAEEEATLTVEQAAQNALLLNTIRQQTKAASQTALSVVSQLPA